MHRGEHSGFSGILETPLPPPPPPQSPQFLLLCICKHFNLILNSSYTLILHGYLAPPLHLPVWRWIYRLQVLPEERCSGLVDLSFATHHFDVGLLVLFPHLCQPLCLVFVLQQVIDGSRWSGQNIQIYNIIDVISTIKNEGGGGG